MTLAFAVLVVTLAAGVYMAWNIGANDVANAMGTSVGSGALTLGAAVVLAGIFEFAGAVLVGGSVTETIRGGIVQVELFDPSGPLGPDGPVLLALGMLSALIAAGAWLHFATHFGLPVSTTHSIVGSVVGFGIASFGWSGVNWETIAQIVLSWGVSPLCGGVLAFATFLTVQRIILRDPDPVQATRRSGPFLVGVVIALMVMSFIYKALSNVISDPPLWVVLVCAAGAAVVSGLVASQVIGRVSVRVDNPYVFVERVFAGLQVITACFVAFAHGANDVANAAGPVAAVASMARTGFTSIDSNVPVPGWVLLLGGGGIVIGLATMGYRVILTVGRQITDLTPTRGFSAEFGAATTVLVASRLGLPISTTHTLVGAVIGVGMAHGIAALNLRVIRNIVNSWLATVPAAAVLSAGIFVVMRLISL